MWGNRQSRAFKTENFFALKGKCEGAGHPHLDKLISVLKLSHTGDAAAWYAGYVCQLWNGRASQWGLCAAL